MPDFTSGERIELGKGYALRAPGLVGRAERIGTDTDSLRSIASPASIFDDVLARTQMHCVENVEVRARPAPASAMTTDLRDVNGDDAMLFEAPDLGPTVGQVVLLVDEAGAMSWHFPSAANRNIEPPAIRGTGGVKSYYIRREAPPAPPESARERALFGAMGRKLLRLIVYPISDIVVGAAASVIAPHWEEANRKYHVRQFSPNNYQRATGTEEERLSVALSPMDYQLLGNGPVLLFVHGTFSTAHGAFHELSQGAFANLHQQYGGRVIAFNHFTLSHDPKENADWLLQHLRSHMPGKTLTLDIISHSRGGLVARTLANGAAIGLDSSQVKVRRIAFVAVPNAGTPLADPNHMVAMIDRMTSALNLVPSGGAADILEGILIAVKIIGHGALKGLTGLGAMHPQGSFLKALNASNRGSTDYFGIAANYEPNDVGLRALVNGTVNAVADRVFQGEENDLVVPERGVYDVSGCDGFPLGQGSCLRIPASAGVSHSSMFGHEAIADRLVGWLQTKSAS